MRMSSWNVQIWLALIVGLVAMLGVSRPAAAEPADSLVTFALLPSRTPLAPFTLTGPPALANPHGDISIPCEACHTPEAWTPLRDEIDFDHSEQTRFVMTGKHEQLECASCHLDLRFDQPDFTADECASCHLDVHRGQLGDACETCHNTQDFHLLNGQFIHAQTAFPLTGSHLQITCESCHTEDPDGLFAPLDTDCFACHAADYQTASSIDHVAAGFSTDCSPCHNTLAFSSAGGFNHVAASDGFALVGTHAEIECAACHTVPGFEPTFDAAGQDDCYACHASDYERTTTIDHVAAGFPTDCQQCHGVTAWENATFEHAAVADGFALVGAHDVLPCSSCHVGQDFEPIFDADGQNDCFACHAQDHEEEHPAFPTNCLQCHSVNTWGDATFEHATVSGGFQLVGAHAVLECSACHVGPDFEPIFDAEGQNDCFACHAEEHEDEHPNFPTNCLQCHTVDTWDDADFDHAAASGGFVLVGAHAPLPCSSCHIGPDFEPIFDAAGQNDCFACHAQDHEEEHPNFPTDCLQCHTIDTWDDANFDHATATGGFALAGAHDLIPCSSCHVGPDFEPIFDAENQNDCFACHAAEHADEHPAFPTDCLQCHTVDTWDDADFDHGSVSNGFQLVGAHTTIECSSCHIGPDFEPIFDAESQNDCVACHAEEHEAEHPDFPTNCLQCHTVNTWDGADFDHNTTTDFDLVGAHVSLPCSSCHVGPDFDLVYTPSGQNDCVACHMADTEDAHPGFPTDCLQCHTVDTWDGATFEHDQYFPIYTGEHAGEWSSCQTCHTQPGNFSVFTCLSCHEHNREEMDDEHEDVGGYVYESNACLACHPDGEDLGSQHEFNIGGLK